MYDQKGKDIGSLVIAKDKNGKVLFSPISSSSIGSSFKMRRELVERVSEAKIPHAAVFITVLEGHSRILICFTHSYYSTLTVQLFV